MAIITSINNESAGPVALPVAPIIGDPNMVNPAPSDSLSLIQAASAAQGTADAALPVIGKPAPSPVHKNAVFLLMVLGFIYIYRRRLA